MSYYDICDYFEIFADIHLDFSDNIYNDRSKKLK